MNLFTFLGTVVIVPSCSKRHEFVHVSGNCGDSSFMQ